MTDDYSKIINENEKQYSQSMRAVEEKMLHIEVSQKRLERQRERIEDIAHAEKLSFQRAADCFNGKLSYAIEEKEYLLSAKVQYFFIDYNNTKAKYRKLQISAEEEMREIKSHYDKECEKNNDENRRSGNQQIW